MKTDEQLGEELLGLYRKQRNFETRTLDGHIITQPLPHRLVSDELEILQKTMGGRAKTRIRKLCKEKGIEYPNFKKDSEKLPFSI